MNNNLSSFVLDLTVDEALNAPFYNLVQLKYSGNKLNLKRVVILLKYCWKII